MRTINHPKDSISDDEDSFIQEKTDHSLVNTYTDPLPPPPPQSLSHKIDNSTISTSDCHADPDCRVSLEKDPVLLSEHTYPQATRQLSTDDTMSTGSVPLKTYLTYLKSVKNPLLLVVAFASYWASNGMQVSHFASRAL